MDLNLYLYYDSLMLWWIECTLNSTLNSYSSVLRVDHKIHLLRHLHVCFDIGREIWTLDVYVRNIRRYRLSYEALGDIYMFVCITHCPFLSIQCNMEISELKFHEQTHKRQIVNLKPLLLHMLESRPLFLLFMAWI